MITTPSGYGPILAQNNTMVCSNKKETVKKTTGRLKTMQKNVIQKFKLPFEDKFTKNQLQNCVIGNRIGVIGTFSSQQNLNLHKQIAK